MTLICPYCAEIIEREKKRKCPTCKSEISFRYNPITNEKSYYKRSDIPTIEKEIEKFQKNKQDISLFEEYKLLFQEKYKISEELFNQELDFWLKKFGDSAKTKKDFIWSLFNRHINSIPQIITTEEELYEQQRQVYVDMYGFLAKEDRNISHIQKLINYCELMKHSFSAVKMNVNFIANNCCAECNKIDGTKMELEEAIKKQPLPNANCTRKNGCFCCYGFEGIRNEKGRLIFK